MKKIIKYHKDKYNIKGEFLEHFTSKLIKQEFPKKTKILDVGETENYLSFIDEGIIRMYFPKKDNDITFSFSFENNFTSAYDSFLTQQPSEYVVETLTNVVLWRLSYDVIEELFEETVEGNFIGRKALEDLYLKKAKREIALLNSTAEERYINLFKERPEIIKEIPLMYIASYIGVTPQSLSRIRKRVF